MFGHRRSFLRSTLGLGSLQAVAGGSAAAQSLAAGLPNVGLTAETASPRSEAGVGALMPWADALWAVTYNSHKQPTGKGLALYRVDDRLTAEKIHVHDGTHANRMIHKESDQCFIGPYAIDAAGNHRFSPSLAGHRLTATLRHLVDPAGKVYMLTMEGLLLELDVDTLEAREIADLVGELGIVDRPHFKGGYTGQGRVVVANNGFYSFGDESAGLWEWGGESWKRLSNKPHMDCVGRENLGNVVFCSGWDERSVLFSALVEGEWQRYRLPKSSHAFAHAWQTEWMRIREVETEHFLMDIQGGFFELQPIAFEGRLWGVSPICRHLRVTPDYCSFRGLLALGGNQTTPNADNNAFAGQPQSGIRFGYSDDLWSWGKPQGWGGVWRRTEVAAEVPSDPFLMTGYDKKGLHVRRHAGGRPKVAVEVDFLGDGEWAPYETVDLSARDYAHHEFPAGFSAHWVRLTASEPAVLSAEFFYS